MAQVAELALDSFDAPDWTMKTILLVLAHGLPLSVFFAWAFELTPDGLKREKDVDRTESITPQTGRKLNYATIGVLAVALFVSVSTHQWTVGITEPEIEAAVATTGDEKSIAVLPFVNMSDDKEYEYFSDGISEELLNVLVKVAYARPAIPFESRHSSSTSRQTAICGRILTIENSRTSSSSRTKSRRT